jgi:ketosteroid isomerase-like protein
MTSTVADRLLSAINAHDLDGIVACFAEDFVSEAPAHPARAVKGRENVRRNWTMMLTERPDVRATVLASVTDGDATWSEWEFTGTNRDGTPFHDRGVIVMVIDGDVMVSNRWFVEPVEQSA